ncbi:MAG: NAD-dependent epimerase/dehydratase family protein, partial [Isosphaeraceae bacterium]
MIDLTDKHIFVAGADTLIGEALTRLIQSISPTALINSNIDLTEKAVVDDLFRNQKPDFVIYAGGRSGGIAANIKYPADLMLNNLYSATNVIHACHTFNVKKLLFLASSCSYPRLSPQPMAEDQLLCGPLEPTNEAYAVAKIAGIKLCQSFRRQYGNDFIVGIPANSFGIHDDFSPEESHVVGALIRRAHEAKQNNHETLPVWGTGNARREFLFADDIADACLFALRNYSHDEPINLAGGTDISIGELAKMICDVVGYKGELIFDT